LKLFGGLKNASQKIKPNISNMWFSDSFALGACHEYSLGV
jgi:hypothetical protein